MRVIAYVNEKRNDFGDVALDQIEEFFSPHKVLFIATDGETRFEYMPLVNESKTCNCCKS